MYDELIVAAYASAAILLIVLAWSAWESWPQIKSMGLEAREIIEALRKRRTK